MYYTEKQLITMMKRAEGFKAVPSAYHIIGVSSSADAPNKFDDTFHLMKGEELIMSTTGTTNPGTSVLKGGFLRYNKDGAAVLERDRVYNNVWKYGLHKGKVPALKQLGAPVAVWRDGDKDGKSEEKGKRTVGYYGINFHPDQYNINGADKQSDNINGWSAGCQVCNNIKDYRKIINLVKEQKFITYTLLNEFSI